MNTIVLEYTETEKLSLIISYVNNLMRQTD